MLYVVIVLGETRFSNGSGGWIRTSDQLINSQLRYHCATPEQNPELTFKWRVVYHISPTTRKKKFCAVV